MTSSDGEGGVQYDIFLSYNRNDEAKVAILRDLYKRAGLRTFFAPRSLREHVGQPGWQEKIFLAVRQSMHMGVYCTKDALLSEWVNTEVSEFKRHHGGRHDAKDHLILVIPDAGMAEADVDRLVDRNPILADVLRPRDAIEVLQIVSERRISSLLRVAAAARNELSQTQEVARQSFDYYRHARFWRPLAQAPNKLHVFTCGRDTIEDPARGAGGRSSIDMWDYQAAVDITHHFATHHRDVGVEIEQPISKSRIDTSTRAFNTARFSSRLTGNCIIIGSPDVSDFAEITLAEILGVEPYDPGATLTRGFKIIKDGQKFSTFYEPSSINESEGVRLIGPAGTEKFDNTDRRTYGVMVLADNPFSREGHKILILAGWSGVATRAMSLLLTVEKTWCLNEFFGLDQRIARMSGALAAVIEVNYQRIQRVDSVGDARSIPETPGSIRFVRAVELTSA